MVYNCCGSPCVVRVTRETIACLLGTVLFIYWVDCASAVALLQGTAGDAGRG